MGGSRGNRAVKLVPPKVNEQGADIGWRHACCASRLGDCRGHALAESLGCLDAHADDLGVVDSCRNRLLLGRDVPLGFAPPAAPSAVPVAPDEEGPLGRPLAQLLSTYVLAEAPDGALVLVDQHAAHERLTHEALKAQFEAGGVRAQPLLLPAVVELPAASVARLLDGAAALGRLGLEIEGFGPGAVLVRALPALLGNPDPAPLLADMAEELAESGEALALADRLDAAIARLACHGSIRAGRRLTGEEMAALLRQMEATPRAATCSHGRPTFIRLGRPELEKLFARR